MLVAMFSNNANYGLPLVLFAFGEEALAFGTVYFVTSAVLTYTVGVLVASSGHRTLGRALTRIFRVPTIYGAVAAGLLVTLAVPVPQLVMRPVSLLSDAAVPMMLLVLGMQLAEARRPTTLPALGTATIARLLVAPVLRDGGGRARGALWSCPPGRHRAGLNAGRRHHDDSGTRVRSGPAIRPRARSSRRRCSVP